MRHSWKCAMRSWEMRMFASLQVATAAPSLSSRLYLSLFSLSWFTARSIVNGCRLQSIRCIPYILIYILEPTRRRLSSRNLTAWCEYPSACIWFGMNAGVIWSLVCGSLIPLLQRRLPRLLCIDNRNETGESSSSFRAKSHTYFWG